VNDGTPNRCFILIGWAHLGVQMALDTLDVAILIVVVFASGVIMGAMAF
jgi:hypothetical protein